MNNTITFEKLKENIKKQIQNSNWLAMQRPGEYCFDRMLQMLNKIPRTDLNQHCGSQEKIKELHQIINDFDIRCLNDLINFCKEFNLNGIPRWLYKDYGIELSDEGWIIFSNENNFEN